MRTLNANAIKDFQICERLYDYRHIEQMPEKIFAREIYTRKFEKTIKSILYYFWYKKQGGVTPSYASLLNRWEKLWFPKETEAYDIISEQHESVYGNISSLTSKAASILLNFYETYSDKDAIPVAISEPYLAKINSNIIIEDVFDLIYFENNLMHVVKFIFNYKVSNSYFYQVDFSCMYSGFKHQHPNRLGLAKFGYVDLLSNDVSFREYKISNEDLEALEYWCDTIDTKEVFVPRRGLTSYCKKCPFDQPCSKWKFPKAIKEMSKND